jgi:DNA topoisomerase-1
MALKLLSLPREVGTHPETGKPIMAGFGRFGPYLSHDGGYASLETPEDVFTVGLNRAVTVIAEKKSKGGKPRGAQALKELGKAPGSDTVIKVMNGRYGPYVSDGKTNATLPRELDPMSVELEQAIELIAARAAKGGPKKKPKKTAKKPAAKGTSPEAKKPAAKKTKKAKTTTKKAAKASPKPAKTPVAS